MALEQVLLTLAQEGFLEREYHDALVPNDLFRQSAKPEKFMAQIGTEMIMTKSGRIEPDPTPLGYNQDAPTVSASYEHYMVSIDPYAKSVDIPLDQARQTIGNTRGLVLEKTKQLGQLAGAELNLASRNAAFLAYLSGHTVARTAGVASVSVPVAALNGFRRFFVGKVLTAVSVSNPLSITIDGVARVVTGVTPFDANFPDGPGTLTISVAHTWNAGAAVIASNAPTIVRPQNYATIDLLTAVDQTRMQHVRRLKAELEQNFVPKMPDGTYHFHAPPTMIQHIFDGNELQRLYQSNPDADISRTGVLGVIHGIKFFSNAQCPLNYATNIGTPFTVPDRSTPMAKKIAAEMANATGVPILRGIMLGADALYEYFVPEMEFFSTDMQAAGKSADPYEYVLSESGLQMVVDRTRVHYRYALDRRGILPSVTYNFSGGWVCPSDGLGGQTPALYKRAGILEAAGN